MKKKTATFDMLGEAQFPSDLLTPSEGSSWGIGEFPDMDYGAGALEAFFPGDTSVLPGVDTATASQNDASFFEDTGPDLVASREPDAAWFANSADDMPGLDLTDTDVFKEGSLSDLSWLELHEQDEDRLPVNPVDLSIPELEEAWGVDRRTDGFSLHSHNKDLGEIRYRQAVADTSGPQFKFTADDLTRVVQRAMRRSASGHPLPEILREAADSLGDEAHRIHRAMVILQSEHGLAGKVFVRAAAYPGYEQGRWADQLRKMAGARYIVVDKRTLTGSILVQDGRCMVTKKWAVQDVPWAEAIKFYRPALERMGRKVAGGDPKKALQAALTTSTPVERQATAFPQHKTVVAMPKPIATVASPKEARENTDRQKAANRIQAWVKSGMLAITEAKAILGSGLSGEHMLRRAATSIIQVRGTAAFSGLLNDARPRVASAQEVRASLASIQPPSPINKMAAAVVGYARRKMSEGIVGRALDELISLRFAAEVREAAGPGLVAARQAHEGASGFVYVDAAAYASPSGVTGCEQGSLKHRANQVKYVMAMDRCASCTLSATRSDGTSVCRQYNKPLVTASDLPDEMPGIRRSNIRAANLNDQQATASYFAPAYDPQEYNLHNASFTDLEIEAAPEHEVLGNILFGGMEF